MNFNESYVKIDPLGFLMPY